MVRKMPVSVPIPTSHSATWVQSSSLLGTTTPPCVMHKVMHMVMRPPSVNRSVDQQLNCVLVSPFTGKVHRHHTATSDECFVCTPSQENIDDIGVFAVNPHHSDQWCISMLVHGIWLCTMLQKAFPIPELRLPYSLRSVHRHWRAESPCRSGASMLAPAATRIFIASLSCTASSRMAKRPMRVFTTPGLSSTIVRNAPWCSSVHSFQVRERRSSFTANGTTLSLSPQSSKRIRMRCSCNRVG